MTISKYPLNGTRFFKTVFTKNKARKNLNIRTMDIFYGLKVDLNLNYFIKNSEKFQLN